jgi:methyl-accepting chemotaxis protein
MYKEIVQGKDLVADILPPPEYIIEANLVCYQLLNETNPQKLNDLVVKSKQLKDDYYDRHKFWIKDLSDGEMKENMINKSFTPAEEYFNLCSQKFIPLILNNKREEAKILLLSDMKEKYELHRSIIDKVVAAANANNSELEITAASTIRIRYIVLLSFGLGILIAIFLFSNSIFKKINSSIQRVLDSLRELSKGHVKIRVGISTGDEIGDIARTLDSLAINLDDFSQIMLRISNGDFSALSKVADDRDELAPALNSITCSLNKLIEETNRLTEAGLNGKLTTRGEVEKFKGNYKTIVAGINSTLDAVIKPIEESSLILDKIAGGDLTARMDGDYKGDFLKIKESINSTSDSLRNAMNEVSQAVASTASAAAQISSGAEEMAAGSQEQSSQTAEVASAMEEMTKTIIETTQNANVAADNSKAAKENALRGAKKVDDTTKGMLKIVEATRDSGRKIAALALKTDQIGEIAQVIDDIADQTNLLALNAAIEAARAGEQGRGFAVVADEVRKLAERTTHATKEIAETIKAIQNEAKDANLSMDNASKAVESGMELTKEVAGVLQDILNGAESVSDVINQVAAASEEQSTTAEEISRNIEGINNVTQQSASGIQQIAGAAEDLNKLTVNLQDLIGRFNFGNGETHYAVRKNGKLIKA